MPTIEFKGQQIKCQKDANLRKTLLENGLSPYNGMAQYANCHGHGTCGTCAVEIEGPVSPPLIREKIRLTLPPHHLDSDLRLSCQTKVLGNIKVTKHDGLWGQKK